MREIFVFNYDKLHFPEGNIRFECFIPESELARNRAKSGLPREKLPRLVQFALAREELSRLRSFHLSEETWFPKFFPWSLQPSTLCPRMAPRRQFPILLQPSIDGRERLFRKRRWLTLRGASVHCSWHSRSRGRER